MTFILDIDGTRYTIGAFDTCPLMDYEACTCHNPGGDGCPLRRSGE